MHKYFIIPLLFLLISCEKRNNPATGWDYNSPYSHDTTFYTFNLEEKMISKDEIPRMTKLPDIILDGTAKTHIIRFDKFSSETYWTVFDSTVFQKIAEEKPMPVLFKKQFAAEENIMYQINQQNIGKYYIECSDHTKTCSVLLKIRI